METLFQEASYLVSRGVRPIALAMDHCEPEDLEKAQKALEEGGYPGALPFVIEITDAFQLGYVAEPWVLELYVWLRGPDVPMDKYEALSGLLFGYSIEAISQCLHKKGDFTRTPLEDPGKTLRIRQK